MIASPDKDPREKSDLAIPSEINSWKSLPTAEYYHRELGWAVHPLLPPNKGKSRERGKKPLHKGWRKHTAADVTPEYLREHFGPCTNNNLGVVVRKPFVHVDLDSKPDVGESVQTWITGCPELSLFPRERTSGGAHFVFICHDLPVSFATLSKALVAKVNGAVMAELYIDGLNIVVSPSVHKDGTQYHWEVTGQIPQVTWSQLKKWFGFQEPEVKKPGRPRKEPPWWGKFSGDLKTLNAVALFKEVKLLGDCLDPDEGKWAATCPWRDDHSDKTRGTSDTVIFNENGSTSMPGFKCLHAHCAERTIRTVLEFFEVTNPGIVDRHCAQTRVWQPGKVSDDKRPQLLLPASSRPDSVFAAEVSFNVGRKFRWFNFADAPVVVRESAQKTVASTGLSIRRIKPVEAITELERHVELGVLRPDGAGGANFVPESMSEATSRILMASPQLLRNLPPIRRVLDVPVPVLVDGCIEYPTPGYDPRFSTYLAADAPKVFDMSLDEARSLLLDELLGDKDTGGFCWADAQSKCHALARIITPFCRGMMGWARAPLWIIEANRERCGKDFFAQIACIVYLGRKVLFAPLSNNSDEEMRKRITTALMANARMIHFANLKGHIRYSALEAATDNTCIWQDRVLGGNTEVCLPNEAEFSFSANAGTTWEPDIEGRSRRISLHFDLEEINARAFRHTDLHGWVMNQRAKILSACAALVKEWDRLGRPGGSTPFSSFPEWATIVGGIMTVCGFDDPCRPHSDPSKITGDQNTEAMKSLFALAFESFGDRSVKKAELVKLIGDHQDDGLLAWIDLESRGGQVQLGKMLIKFVGRTLGGIRLTLPQTGKNNVQYRFSKDAEGSREGISGISGISTPAIYRTENNHKLTEEKPNNNDSHSEVGDIPHIPDIPPLVESASDFGVIAAAIAAAGTTALDLETFGSAKNDALNPWRGDIRLLTLKVPGRAPWLIDIRATGYDLGELGRAIESAEVIAHNAKFDLLWLAVKTGIHPQRVFCTLTAARLLSAGTKPGNNLDNCLERFLGVSPTPDQSQSDWGSMLLTDDQLAYAARDVNHLHDLAESLNAELGAADLVAVNALEMGLIPVVVAMEEAGIAMDKEKLESICNFTREGAHAKAEELRVLLATPSLNPASHGQLKEALGRKGIHVDDTKEETLKAANDGRIIPAILDLRGTGKKAQQAKLLLESIEVDGRIHGGFEPTGTDTGRFSSKKPNLQNIGRGEVRDCFISPPGSRLIVADYSQVELRAAAVIAGEARMIEAYQRGDDLHKLTAATVLGKPLEEVTREDRQLAKAVNFGLLYGQSAGGLVRYAASSYGVTLKESDASEIRRAFFTTYNGIARWHRDCQSRAKKTVSEVRTALGRRRLIPKADEEWKRFTTLVNTPVQGGCADGMKRALILIASRLPAGSKIISTVHDEVIVEAPEADVEAACVLVRDSMIEAMEALYPQIPIEVEASVCDRWGEK